jgi:uncharacterized protein
MKVVIDTNVIVSGFLSPHGPPAQILYRLSQGDLEVLYDIRILEEYREVLSRPDFELPIDVVQLFMKRIQEEGKLIVPRPLPHPLQDPDDEAFLEVALEGNADFLVTGNLRHFPKSSAGKIAILSPAEFINKIR